MGARSIQVGMPTGATFTEARHVTGVLFPLAATEARMRIECKLTGVHHGHRGVRVLRHLRPLERGLLGFWLGCQLELHGGTECGYDVAADWTASRCHVHEGKARDWSPVFLRCQ